MINFFLFWNYDFIFFIRFQTFGDLFTRCPLAIQTQHPGFYYQEAAYQSMARKQIAQTTCRRIEQIDFDSSEFLKVTEFYGQRPWRQHHQSKLIKKIKSILDSKKKKSFLRK